MTLARRALAAFASLRLTVALLAMAMVLIFAGTLAQTNQGIWHVVDTYFRSALAWIPLSLFVPRAFSNLNLSFPIPGGLFIAGAMLVNLLAAHALRFKLTARRSGVILLHAGLIVLLLGEFVTAFTAREGVMRIDEGASSSYIEDVRSVELAIIDPSDPTQDRVTVIPQHLLERHAARRDSITHPDLPFSITVVSWLPNSGLVANDTPDPSHRGLAQRLRPIARPPARGVDGAESDLPSAYVQLWHANQDLGVYLVSANLLNPQPITAGGRTYHVALRFTRTYKPYTLHLLDFSHDKFTGTEIARNFSSHVRLVDPSRAVEREALISMNQPLRYEGETFYQASFKPDNTGTVLQVVRNPGWLLPYLSCVMVGAGLIVHFTIGLATFMNRRRAPAPNAGTTEQRRFPALPIAAALIGAALALSPAARPQPAHDLDISAVAAVPVSSGGRTKPFDTHARAAVLAASGRQTLRDSDREYAATAYVLDLIARPERVKDVPVVKVDHPDLLTLLGADPTKPARLSLVQIEPHWPTIGEQADKAMALPPKQRDPYHRALVKLFGSVAELLTIARMGSPYWVPPAAPGGEWRPFHVGFQDARLNRPEGAGAATIARVMAAYHDSNQSTLDTVLAEHASIVDAGAPGASTKARLELWFNRAQPFLGASVVYVLAFLVLCAALLLRNRNGPTGERCRTISVGLIAGALLIHTAALITRMYLQGRPPVTNLYSSAVFVGWAAVGLGLLLERWFPIALSALAASSIGFCTLIVAHNLGQDGDTMGVMQAVLDTNFWLATHVVTITLGYSASLFAGLLGATYLLIRATSRTFTEQRARPLASMTYAVVCFATLLSFIGTVLGGIWADQSWGRFWGWDPKENGAALVVLINAVILHARWGGLVRAPGIAALAVLGNIVVAWSWFGTNMLGVGLHSYGFMDSAAFWLLAFVLLNVGLASLALARPRNPAL
ncbi:MAG TPA: cytochrome c biogenesis protein CcsA [Phycisphaerales bacterium]|nr:cytochrome c biogenesis protein CcsA [Phycisphaerales bacterium]